MCYSLMRRVGVAGVDGIDFKYIRGEADSPVAGGSEDVVGEVASEGGYGQGLVLVSPAQRNAHGFAAFVPDTEPVDAAAGSNEEGFAIAEEGELGCAITAPCP
jgi:hypothetical protein